MITLKCTANEFFHAAKELLLALPILDDEQVDTGLKALGLMYLGVDLDQDKNDLLLYKCALVYKMVIERAIQSN